MDSGCPCSPDFLVLTLCSDATHPPSSQDVEELISVIHAQDCSSAFRKLLGSTWSGVSFVAAGAHPSRQLLVQHRHAAHQHGPTASIVETAPPERKQLCFAGTGRAPTKATGQRIVLLVSDNTATQVALQVRLCCVVPLKALPVGASLQVLIGGFSLPALDAPLPLSSP